MSKRLTRLPALLLLTLSLSPLAHADQASKDAKIQQLLDLTHVDHLMSQMGNQMLAQMNNMIKGETAGAELNDKQKQILSTYTGKVETMVHEQLTWAKVKPQFTTLYSDTYTEAEIDGILTFYKSPVGQTMLAKLPELNSKSLQIGQSQVSTIIPQLREMSGTFAHDMTAAATKPAAPGATTPPASKPAPASSHP